SYSPPTLKSATSSLTPASAASTPTSLTHMQTPAIKLLASTPYMSSVSFFTPFLHATNAPAMILLPYMLMSLQQASVLISTTPYKLANSLETLSWLSCCLHTPHGRLHRLTIYLSYLEIQDKSMEACTSS